MSANQNNNTNSSSSAASSSSSSSAAAAAAGVGPCGACKFLRRKCLQGCIFAPYFDAEQGAGNFAAVHKVFGASNVSKLLLQIPDDRRQEAVITICYEAQARLRDPVYGCVSHIFSLQQQVVNLQTELSYWQAHMSSMEFPPPPPPPSQAATVSILDFPTALSNPHHCDLSSLFDNNTMHHQSSWAMHQQQHQPRRRHLGSEISATHFLGFDRELHMSQDTSPPCNGVSTAALHQF